MIPKLNSSDFNDLLLNTIQNFNSALDEYKNMCKDMQHKSNIIEHELQYSKELVSKKPWDIQIVDDTKYNTVYYLKNGDIENCESYGIGVTPKLLGTPINIFNLTTMNTNNNSGTQYYFRNDAVVKIRNIADTTDNSTPWLAVSPTNNMQYLDILKHDSIADKQTYFEVYEHQYIQLEIDIADTATMLGPTIFNALEFDSFLCGSYDIISIQVYNPVQSNNNDVITELLDNNKRITSAGQFKYTLSEHHNFKKICITFKLNWQHNGKYPFGLKHIYLYNENYNQYEVDTDGNKEPLSYIISTVELAENANLDVIDESIILKSIDNEKVTNCAAENITFYYIDNIDENNPRAIELYTNEHIGLNVNKFYVKIPLVETDSKGNTINRNLIALAFKYSTRNDIL